MLLIFNLWIIYRVREAAQYASQFLNLWVMNLPIGNISSFCSKRSLYSTQRESSNALLLIVNLVGFIFTEMVLMPIWFNSRPRS